ncbi:MFS transporter [bacterium]|nr:MFS transporter [bacterium]
MYITLSPLKNSAQFRNLFLGQTISFFGSMMTYVAIPYQIYELTQSSFLVGLLGAVQLVPLVLAGLYGGSLADSMDRRKILLISEILLILVVTIMAANCFLQKPSVILLFVLAAIASVLAGFHRPAMEAIVPQLVNKEDYSAVAALSSLRYAIGAVAAPALSGILIAKYGLVSTYIIDAATYVVALWSLWSMQPVAAPASSEEAGWQSIKNGFIYATQQPILVGTYLIDILAMLFAMPMALYPAMAVPWGGAKAAGWLYAALPIGAMAITLFSGFADRIRRQGAAVVVAAISWGVFIIFLAFAGELYLAVICLALAGAADAVSAIYRQTIWNDMIPENFRGRLAGLNMLSYMIGPLIGNARAGAMASMGGNFFSIFWGGVLCVITCTVMTYFLPTFWNYKITSK